jgi:hypothetical protein
MLLPTRRGTTVKRADAMDKLMDRKVFNARDARWAPT